MKKISQRKKIYIALLLGLTQAPLMAQSPQSGALGACKISPLAQYVQPVKHVVDDEIIYLSGKYADSDDQFSNIREDIIAYYGNSRVDADHVVLDRKANILSGKDQNIRYASDSVVLESKTFTSYLTNKEYEGTDVTYYLHDVEAQGKAKYAINRQNDRTADFEKVTYSTCPVGDEIWQLSSDELHLDQESGRGIAKHAKFSVFGVPVLYSPYFSFPIDDRRQTGFLFPTATYDKDGGLSVRLPYYINLAPNYDLTLTPGYYTRRGLILAGEGRYLNKWQDSVLRLEYLPHDRRFSNDERKRTATNGLTSGIKKDSKRWSVLFDQQLKLRPRLTGRILFQQVSDDQYAEDIQDAVGLLTTTSLERLAELNYSERNWRSTLRFQHFQVLDREIIPNNPYARMPQLLFDAQWREESGLIYGMNAEAVHFTTTVTRKQAGRPESAIRLDLMPYVGFRAENSWGFFEPRLAYRFTHYDLKYKTFSGTDKATLDINTLNRDKDTNMSRGLPIFSVDTGIFLERDTSFTNLFGGGNFIQTLEPRLFYLNVPYREQSDIPLFDTGVITPSYENLFTTNQFTGADRQSNANQLTTALTTRFLNDETGVEHFRLSVGQIYYFEQPRITTGKDILPKDQCLVANKDKLEAAVICRSGRQSEWFVENNILLTKDLSSKVTWQWSPDVKGTTRLSYDLRYQPEDRKVINIGQRYSRNPQDAKDSATHQIDITSFWEINSNWAVVGRYNYSLDDHKLNDSYLGFEYSDCCVATRFATRYYRNNLMDDEKHWKAYLQFEFKGLGNVGQDTDSLWGKTVTGYQSKSLTRGNRGF